MASRQAREAYPRDESSALFDEIQADMQAAFDRGAVTALREAADKVMNQRTRDWLTLLANEWEASGE